MMDLSARMSVTLGFVSGEASNRAVASLLQSIYNSGYRNQIADVKQYMGSFDGPGVGIVVVYPASALGDMLVFPWDGTAPYDFGAYPYAHVPDRLRIPGYDYR